MSTNVISDEMSAVLLHHVPGLDSAGLINTLLARLHDRDKRVSYTAIHHLVAIARQPGWRDDIIRAVIDVMNDPSLQPEDEDDHRPDHDSAYHALWQISQGHAATIAAHLP